MDGLHWLRQGDAVTQATAALLLVMSVASWVVIFWKLRLMRRAHVDMPRCPDDAGLQFHHTLRPDQHAPRRAVDLAGLGHLS